MSSRIPIVDTESVAVWCVNRIRFYQAALEYDQPVTAASCRTYTFRLAPDG